MQFVTHDISQAAIERSSLRFQPDAVVAMASEFSSLLEEVQVANLGPENRRRLVDVLDAFEQLLIEMKATCDAVRRAPAL